MKSNLPPEQLAKILGQTSGEPAEPERRAGDPRTLPPPQRVCIAAVDMPWAETFVLCLKWAICAIPAIWIAAATYRIPGFIIDSMTAASVINSAPRHVPSGPGGMPGAQP